jgi:hypothetical protein
VSHVGGNFYYRSLAGLRAYGEEHLEATLHGTVFEVLEAGETITFQLGRRHPFYRRSDKDSWFWATNTPEILGFQGH